MAFNDGVKVGPVAYIGLVSVIVTFVLVLLLQVLYYQLNKSLAEAEFAEMGPPLELTELTATQQTALTQRGYLDRERGIVAIGIQRAKELVVTELASGKAPNEVVGPARPQAVPAEQSASSGETQDVANEATPDNASDSETPIVMMGLSNWIRIGAQERYFRSSRLDVRISSSLGSGFSVSKA